MGQKPSDEERGITPFDRHLRDDSAAQGPLPRSAGTETLPAAERQRLTQLEQQRLADDGCRHIPD